MIILFQCSCGGDPLPTEIMVNSERRHMVICLKCQRRTLHYFSPSLAGAEWNTEMAAKIAKK